jgi:hypothetical protein
MSDHTNPTDVQLVDLHLRIPKRLVAKVERLARALDTSPELVATLISMGALSHYTNRRRVRRDHLLALLRGTIRSALRDLEKETPNAV